LTERGSREIAHGVEGRGGSKKGKKGKEGKKADLSAFLAALTFWGSALHSFDRCSR
jgi:hypothetical protein